MRPFPKKNMVLSFCYISNRHHFCIFVINRVFLLGIFHDFQKKLFFDDWHHDATYFSLFVFLVIQDFAWWKQNTYHSLPDRIECRRSIWFVRALWPHILNWNIPYKACMKWAQPSAHRRVRSRSSCSFFIVVWLFFLGFLGFSIDHSLDLVFRRRFVHWISFLVVLVLGFRFPM